MAYEVLLQPRARKEFLALPPDIVKTITQALHTLEQKPRSHQSIKWSGGEGYRLRIGDYRILYGSTIRPGRSSCIVSSIAEKPIDSPAETLQGSPAQGGQQAHRPSPVSRRPHVRPRTRPPRVETSLCIVHRREAQERMRARRGKASGETHRREADVVQHGRKDPTAASDTRRSSVPWSHTDQNILGLTQRLRYRRGT